MYRFAHYNFNVFNLEKSLQFYDEALGLKEVKRHEGSDFTLVYLGDGKTDFRLELTYNHDRKEPYNLGENEFHLAFTTENYEESYAKHTEMGCICYDNKNMGIYFINDPDNYWLEVVPEK